MTLAGWIISAIASQGYNLGVDATTLASVIGAVIGLMLAYIDAKYPHHDNRTGAVVHTLTQEVLAESALLTLEGVGQGLEGAVAFALDGRRLLGVVEEAVHSFLQHTLLVAQNHLGSLNLDELLEAVVADDTIAFVEIRHWGCK